MVKRLLLAALLISGCNRAGSGGDGGPILPFVMTWTNQQRTPTSSHLRAVRFSDVNTGWVAGESTSFLRTTDGGATWTQQQQQPVNRGGNIAALDIAGGTVALAVGADGSVGRYWSTTTSGRQWNTPDVAVTGFSSFTSTRIFSTTSGYALASDGTILRLDGSTFSVGAAGTYNGLSFPVDTLIGFVCGNGGVLRKTTDGANFAPLVSGVATPLRKFSMVNAIQGYVVGDAGVVLRTGDGSSWVAKSTGTAAALRGVHFPQTAATGWVVGDGGVIFRTDTSGDAWTAQASGVAVNLYDIWMLDNANGYVVGDFGTVLKTTNGGATWTNLTQGSLAQLNSVSFSGDGQTGYAAGNGGVILVTTNGGATWAASPSGVGVDLLSISVPTTGAVAYACGGGGMILRTTNTGASWSNQSIGAMTLRSILFPVTDTTGYVVGDGSTIQKTTDGSAWSAQASPVASNFFVVSAPFTGLTAYASGSAGVVIRTDNGGVTWTNVSPPGAGGTTLRTMQSPSAAVALTIGADGNLYRTLSGGTVWSTIAIGIPALGLAFSGVDRGWSVDGGIFFTTNGGTNWSQSFPHTNYALRGIWMSSDGVTGCAVGDNGTVLRTATGGQ